MSSQDNNKNEKGVMDSVSETVSGAAQYAQDTASAAYQTAVDTVSSAADAARGTVHDKAKEAAKETENLLRIRFATPNTTLRKILPTRQIQRNNINALV